MTQLIDLIEDIRKFNFDHNDYRGYFSSMKSYRQIDDTTSSKQSGISCIRSQISRLRRI